MRPEIFGIVQKQIDEFAKEMLNFSGTDIDEDYFKSKEGFKDYADVTDAGLNSVFADQIWNRYCELAEEYELEEAEEDGRDIDEIYEWKVSEGR